MSEQLRESLSAAMDGEADAFELRRVLDEAGHDDALRDQWHRLHLMRDLMREDVKRFDPDFRADLLRALNAPHEEEDSVTELVVAVEDDLTKTRRSVWFGRLTGTAVAAAVAVVVMFNGGVFESESSPVGFTGEEFAVGEQAPGSLAVQPVLYQQATVQDEQRQQGLMLHHIQQRAMNQAGVASFVKMATFNRARPVLPARSEQSEAAPDR